MSHTSAIQAKAAQLLQNGEVECVLGYQVGPRGWVRPAFVRAADEVERLVWNQDCTHNLTTYLPRLLRSALPAAPKMRVAVVVKPCDARAINVLLAESQFERDQVHVIGVVCEGISQGAGFRPLAGSQAAVHLQSRCLECTERMPTLADTRIGDPISVVPRPGVAEDMALLEAMTPRDRAEYWLRQFDRCIRCYACRQVCPMCNCPICLYERDDSLWVGMGIGLSEKRTFHLGRAFHLAGRCIGCNECERVCPMEIPISLLNRRLAKEVEALFGYRAGVAPTPGPLITVLGDGEVAP